MLKTTMTHRSDSEQIKSRLDGKHDTRLQQARSLLRNTGTDHPAVAVAAEPPSSTRRNRGPEEGPVAPRHGSNPWGWWLSELGYLVQPYYARSNLGRQAYDMMVHPFVLFVSEKRREIKKRAESSTSRLSNICLQTTSISTVADGCWPIKSPRFPEGMGIEK